MRRDPLPVGERRALGRPAHELRHVEPVLDVEAARVVADTDDGRAARGQLGRRHAAHLAEALDDAALLREIPAQPLAGPVEHHHDPAPGLVAEERAAERDRLAGHDLRHGVAHLHRVRVHHPGHRLLVRGHVRSRDVLLGADHRQQLGGVAPRQPLDLAHRHVTRAAADTAFGAAVRKTQQRALPRHPHRQRRALAERDVRVVADPALRRPEDGRVLYAVCRQHGDVPRVEMNRHGDDHGALRIAQPLGYGRRDVGVFERLLELRERRPPERGVPLESRRFLDRSHGRGV